MRTPLDDAAMTDADPDGEFGSCSVSTTMHTTHAVADVLIVLDRSESMNWSLTTDAACSSGASTCSTRLAAVTSALGALVTDNPAIHWGLELFPTPNASATCTVAAAPQVAVAAGTGATMKSKLASLTTARSTPTASAIEVATAYLKKLADGNNKAILLATDGLPTCAAGESSWNDENLSGAVSAAGAAKASGFPVYLIGIGPDVSNLNSLAKAGGTGSYYPVTSTAQLDSALRSVANVITSCTFKAAKAPTDKNQVYVYVDRERVDQDPDNGWVFDLADSTHATITLTGTYCQDMLTGTTSSVEIALYKCLDAEPPSRLP
jgi:hypothetical protein